MPRQTTAKAGGAPIDRISWQGNTVVSAAKLSQVLGLKAGDAYDSAAVAKRLGYDPKGDVGSLYMDQGYMFFSVTPTATRQPNGTVALAFAVSEGPQIRVRNLRFVGNKKVSTAELTKLVPLRSGELFSRTKLIQSQQKLVQTGYFEPLKIGINPQPVMKPTGQPDQTDMEFVLVEKK
jgi:outer membrane protein assembly factor BamA